MREILWACSKIFILSFTQLGFLPLFYTKFVTYITSAYVINPIKQYHIFPFKENVRMKRKIFLHLTKYLSFPILSLHSENHNFLLSKFSFSMKNLFYHFFFKVHFIDYAITVAPFFYPLYFPSPCTPPSPPALPPLVHVHGSYI